MRNGGRKRGRDTCKVRYGKIGWERTWHMCVTRARDKKMCIHMHMLHIYKRAASTHGDGCCAPPDGASLRFFCFSFSESAAPAPQSSYTVMHA